MSASSRVLSGFERLGNKDSAKIEYDEALQPDPGLEEAKKSLANLK
ncbi:MAG: hypothetical protein M1378_02295 [Bacteroidetes bacterium]|nr:hypothetical protein [Bacteroidota bacterium]